MLNTGNVLKNLLGSSESEKAKQAQAESKLSSNLASNKGFLMFIKYAVFVVLAAFNVHLFKSTLPGFWGYFVGGVAVLSECEAIYCFNNYSRSEGRHKFWLGFFAVWFTAMSLTHALASNYIMQGGLGLDAILYTYSHKLAFPAIFASLVASVAILHLSHWRTKIAEREAAAAIEIAGSRADLLTQQAKLNDEGELREAQVKHLEQRLIHEEKEISLLESLAALTARKNKALKRFEGADYEAMMQSFGRTATTNASTQSTLGFVEPPKKP